MPLKLIKISPKANAAVLITAAVFIVVLSYFFIKWNFATSIAANLDAKKAESLIVADWLIGLAPNDPQTHYAAGLLLERTFNQSDLERSVAEYGRAAELSPSNYVVWLRYGQALSLAGDADDAMLAVERAVELAPNNASVLWVYGNSLVRRGDTERGFEAIRKAAAGNKEYERPASSLALQIFEGDVEAARSAIGRGPEMTAALALTLAARSNFEEAYACWSSISEADRRGPLNKIAETLGNQMLAAKRYSLAAKTFEPAGELRPTVGSILNGGFEANVKLSGAPIFDWQLTDGTEPQIALTDSQKHGGSYSLVMSFSTFESAGYRMLSQTIAVEPDSEYEIEGWFRGDLKTNAALKWQVIDAAASAQMAISEPLVSRSDWAAFRIRFRVPADVDGIVLRLIREGCAGPACPMNGKVWWDDLSIKRL